MFDLYIEHKTLRRFHLREQAHVVFPRRTYNVLVLRTNWQMKNPDGIFSVRVLFGVVLLLGFVHRLVETACHAARSFVQ